MSRSLPLNRSLSMQDLTVGAIGAIVSLAVTLLQHLNGHDGNNSAALQAAMEAIQLQLAKLLRRLKAARQRQQLPRRSVPRALNTTLPTVATLNATLPRVAPLDATFAAPLNASFRGAPLNTTLPTVAPPLNVTLPRVAPLDGTFSSGLPRPALNTTLPTVPALNATLPRVPPSLDATFAMAQATVPNAPGINATFPAPPSGRTLPTPDDYVCPPGYREISNIGSLLEESSQPDLLVRRSSDSDSSTRGDMTPPGLELSYDPTYYPHLNQIVADPESSAAFLPTFNSTRPDLNVTSERGALNASLLPRRVAELRGSANTSIRSPSSPQSPYQIRVSGNTRNRDGSLSHVSRTVSGPDPNNVQILNTIIPPFDPSKSK